MPVRSRLTSSPAKIVDCCSHHQEYDKGITASLANVLSSIMISRLMLNLRDPLIISGRNVRPDTLTNVMDTLSANDSCISNGEVFLQQLGRTPSQITLLKSKACARTPSDATSATVVHLLYGHSKEGEERFVGDTTKYQRK
ncbi:hypothetical protein AN958_07137 [Leucoagaricus sp. SymC.cos]|nr:hypothetical protein AN958_07137 [Leucoagaricus sp. SymC.cos]